MKSSFPLIMHYLFVLTFCSAISLVDLGVFFYTFVFLEIASGGHMGLTVVRQSQLLVFCLKPRDQIKVGGSFIITKTGLGRCY